MRILLDTHAILWLALDSHELPMTVRNVICNPENESFVSIVSAWEISIKISIGKLQLEGGVPEFFSIASANGFKLLPILQEHLMQVESLPFFHRDPFDRMLVAAAISENMHVISRDSQFGLYGVPCIW
ncbi:MAG: type II toxin-antitoxin system VapC family toxin [Spirochaetota bacterium]|jgi:PIN domain nuclease of toxin-antitoxin system|nr:type II toxin-antitoxin system VapC family toxin [Spirochaetota bacterium]